MTIICPYCLSELSERTAACPQCGGRFEGRNPVGTLPVGTVLGGRYTVGEIEQVDGEGILYRGAENHGRFRVTIKEYLPLTLAAERGTDATLRPKLGSEVLFKTTRMDFADQRPGSRAGCVRGEQHGLCRDGKSRRGAAGPLAGDASRPVVAGAGLRDAAAGV